MDNYTKKLQILQREDRTREIESAFETKFIPEIARKWPSETTATRKKKTIPGLTFPTDYALREWNDRPTYSSYEMDREMVSISFNLSMA